MNAVDSVILGILLISTGISFIRGFMREVLSLTAWIAAVWVAVAFTPPLSILLVDHIANESIRLLAAFVGLFLSTLIVGSLLNFFIGQLVRKTGFSGTDRMIGLVFGFARGGVIVAVLLTIVGFTQFPQETWWQESALVPHFNPLVAWLGKNFPADVSTQFAFGSDL
ncbi:MAG: CvpA family protein [Gammaproteobacteria bacterium]|nr:CvpA family protein [Gammaproteobacteria bacterium]